jgi:hypothetical protein
MLHLIPNMILNPKQASKATVYRAVKHGHSARTYLSNKNNYYITYQLILKGKYEQQHSRLAQSNIPNQILILY